LNLLLLMPTSWLLQVAAAVEANLAAVAVQVVIAHLLDPPEAVALLKTKSL